MYNPITVITIVCVYVGLLFLIALSVERGKGWIKRIANSPVVYSLALAVYCTSWTYYGSVGSAANSGMLFLTVYLGPTLAIGLWWFVARKLVRIKTTHRITSIADFISARYGKSQGLAAIATALALVGTTPYIALQLKAVTSTFALITIPDSSGLIQGNVGPIVVVLMTIFTIVIGVRRLDPTERHEGVMTALAVESVVKLAAFMAVGLFVTYYVYDGYGDIFQRLSASSIDMFTKAGKGVSSYMMWMTYLVLSMSAIMFLPRQFHVAVVENSNEKNLKTAIWMFPLYLFLINIFVIPIAAGGLLQGQPASQADTFVLGLPLLFNQSGLALAVFIGGFSAATGMIIVSSMTTATMVTNHLILPLVEWSPWLRFLQRHLLRVRWAAVAAILIMGYGFERLTGESYTLVNMGIISFAAVLQFAPSILGGLFWKQGNRRGALLGLSAGFGLWFYTLLLPSFARSGWITESLLTEGPFGLSFLRPEQLFGVVGLASIPHTVVWTMIFNIGLYVLGSLYYKQEQNEEELADAFVDSLIADITVRAYAAQDADIEFIDKKELVESLLHQYFTHAETTAIVNRGLRKAEIEERSQVSVTELARFYSEVEKSLAGSIGAAAAHRTFSQTELFSDEESKELSQTYSEILAGLRVSPEELQARIDYYQERDTLLTGQAADLERKVADRTRALEASARISRQLTTILDINELLKQIVNLMQGTFNYDHVHIYLVNETGTGLVLREGTGEVGQQLKAQGHTLPLGQGIVGNVASRKRAMLDQNVKQNPLFIHNPILPKAQAELAVPLRKGSIILGVLDLQSEQAGDFSQEDLTVVQSIADHIAVALDNAYLFQEVEAALIKARSAQERYVGQSWQKSNITARGRQYYYVGPTASTLNEAKKQLLAQAKQQALNQKRPAIITLNEAGNGKSKPQTPETKPEPSESDPQNPKSKIQNPKSVVAPITLRDKAIGALHLHPSNNNSVWTEQDLTMIETIINRFAQTAENLRLFDETHERANREQAIREITDRLRAAPNLNRLVEIATEELGQRFSAAHAELELGIETDSS